MKKALFLLFFAFFYSMNSFSMQNSDLAEKAVEPMVLEQDSKVVAVVDTGAGLLTEEERAEFQKKINQKGQEQEEDSRIESGFLRKRSLPEVSASEEIIASGAQKLTSQETKKPRFEFVRKFMGNRLARIFGMSLQELDLNAAKQFNVDNLLLKMPDELLKLIFIFSADISENFTMHDFIVHLFEMAKVCHRFKVVAFNLIKEIKEVSVKQNINLKNMHPVRFFKCLATTDFIKNQKIINTENVIYLAIIAEDIDLLNELLDPLADQVYLNKLLELAVRFGSEKSVEFLLSRGAQANILESKNKFEGCLADSIIWPPVYVNKVPIGWKKFLLAIGCDSFRQFLDQFNLSDSLITNITKNSLSIAKYGFYTMFLSDIFDFLHDQAKVYFNSRDVLKRVKGYVKIMNLTLLQRSIFNNDSETFDHIATEFLAKAKPINSDVNCLNITPLHLAAIVDNLEAVKKIIVLDGVKLEIDKKDVFQKTALFYAKANRNHRMVNYLIAHGANLALAI